MNEIAILRKHALDQNEILMRSEYIESEENVADPISRGNFSEFVVRANAMGFSEFQWLDIRRERIPVDFDQLIAHLMRS